MFVNTLYSILAIAGIGLVIFVHELGHFLAARLVGIRVEAFSLGFGPKLFSFRRGVTEWKVCLIPLGGFVKMAGETPGAPRTGASDEFASKTVAQRTLVISAGVIMNVVFALVALPIAFMWGVPFETTDVGAVEMGTAAWQAGIQPGDRVTSVDGRKVLSYEDLATAVAIGGNSVKLDVRRGTQTFTLEVPTRRDQGRGLQTIGISPSFRPVEITAALVDPAQAAADGRAAAEHRRNAGLQAGDRIVAIDDLTLGEFADEYEFRPHTLAVQRGGATIEIVLPPLLLEEKEPTRPMFGLSCEPTVVRVRAASLAEKLGFLAGDRIERLGDQALASQVDLVPTLFAARGGRTITVRGANGSRRQINADLSDLAVRNSIRRDIEMGSAHLVPVAGSAAELAGVRPGDELIKLDDQPATGFSDIIHLKRDQQNVVLTVRRASSDSQPGESLTIPVTRAPVKHNQAFRDFLFEQPQEVVRTTPGEALGAGFDYTVMMTARVVNILGSLFARRVSADKLGGFITIVRQSVRSSQIALSRGLLFMAVISINLAVLNILPIPVLDGGWLLFLFIEKIKGKPVSEGVINIFSWVGFLLIVGLMLFVTWNDIRNWLF